MYAQAKFLLIKALNLCIWICCALPIASVELADDKILAEEGAERKKVKTRPVERGQRF